MWGFLYIEFNTLEHWDNIDYFSLRGKRKRFDLKTEKANKIQRTPTLTFSCRVHPWFMTLTVAFDLKALFQR